MIEKKFKELKEDQNTKILEFKNKIISSDPVFSAGYCDCNAVILFGNGVAGVSHYPFFMSPSNPDLCISQMIKKVHMISKECKLEGVLIGGDETHFERNRYVLNMNNVPIIGAYLDKWSYSGDGDEKIGEKDLIVVPKTKEVFLYINHFMIKTKEYIQVN